ncbi:GRX1 Glutaredoxin-1 [Candida maltosa Xu316]|uniref:Glutaredoxin n=1 Tax=Candida maltosa (strain Xu316) TaxID=1245528 RepID=M3IHU0_CANMX|nr:Glutaredoxin [Candida maltosa Xu316]
MSALHWIFNWWYAPEPISAEVEKEVEHTIESNKVLIYSKTFCPFCKSTKAVFDELGQEYTVVNLNTLEDGLGIQNYLFDKTGQYMVPNVFINGQHIGGNSDIQKLKQENKLEKLLEQ